MSPHRRQRAEITAHYVESFAQRSLHVCCCHSLAQIMYYSLIHIMIASGMLQTSYAPVIVGRETIVQIVETSDFTQRDKSLMTHSHTVLKRVERQHLRCAQMPRSQHPSVTVHYIGLTIDYARKIIIIAASASSCNVSGEAKRSPALRNITYSPQPWLCPCSSHHIYLCQVR